MSTQLAPIPVLAPGTYTVKQILEWAIGVVEAEPRRLFMYNWMTYYKGEPVFGAREPAPNNPVQVPACGTVGCLAGWIGLGIGMEDPEVISGTPVLDALSMEGRARSDLYRIFSMAEATTEQALAELKAYIKYYDEKLQLTYTVE